MSTLQTVIIVIHLVLVLALIGVVLLQRSEGGLGLGGGGGVSGFMSGRGSANALTRATAFLAACFFVTSMALSMIASHGSGPRSILDQGGNTLQLPPSAPQEQGGGAPAPAVPAPAAPQVPQSQ